ncbi:class I SAM-dependent methyltransferase [Hydrogenophaga sp.]|uniref:class I SAM-dependent methyltransferase n=1 Tax=Hydrogenophaga sp. TaxID=1904254 RepID=UPI0025BF2D09|nr:class I SAM-dependent methyltransferase [Hydrogenophaga sp.]MBT9466174.1 class I SAM-dependent methyltransferase [Hydrogenophaga sp.]
MSTATFSADWLQQREPFDAAARGAAAEHLQLQSRLAALHPSETTPWRVIDLACGTGANLRWLAPRLGGAQQWLVVDHDAALLHCWPERLAAAGGAPVGSHSALEQPLCFTGPGFDASIARQQLDLMTGLETLPWHAADLVTASALLDLVGTEWLHRLVAACAASRVALLMSLNVDGRHVWTPEDPMDATVGRLFGEHQRRDKGLGPALGSGAVAALQGALESAGYRVFSAASDWWVDGAESPQARSLQRTLIDGMAVAASEQSRASAPSVRAWRRRRRAMASEAHLRVGHLDLLALPS